jgi:hypothetical protein
MWNVTQFVLNKCRGKLINKLSVFASIKIREKGRFCNTFLAKPLVSPPRFGTIA